MNDLLRHFEALHGALRTHRGLWAPRPFAQRRLDWQDDFPQVSSWLLRQSSEVLDALEAEPCTVREAPAALMRWAQQVQQLCQIPSLKAPVPQALLAPKYRVRVSGRKWAQVQAFVGAAQAHLPVEDRPVVDWCSGKGHLGRAFHITTGCPVHHLEVSEALCQSGAAVHQHLGLSGLQFHAVDVLQAGRAHLGPGRVAVALHACGHLWRTLLSDAREHGAQAVVAPCCYHRLGGAGHYTPLSEAGRAQGLALTQPQLRIATAQESIASPQVRQRRRRHEAYRLGLDLLLREASGQDVYVPQGTFPKPMMDLSFRDFCEQAATRMQRDLPNRWHALSAQRAGQARAHEVLALSVVRGLFRRPLELWLVLDAAVAELEAGRRVLWGRFCDAQRTPRNLMLVSSPPSG